MNSCLSLKLTTIDYKQNIYKMTTTILPTLMSPFLSINGILTHQQRNLSKISLSSMSIYIVAVITLLKVFWDICRMKMKVSKRISGRWRVLKQCRQLLRDRNRCLRNSSIKFMKYKYKSLSPSKRSNFRWLLKSQ